MTKSLSLSALCLALAISGCSTVPKKPAPLASGDLAHGDIAISYDSPQHQAKGGSSAVVAFYPPDTHIKRPYRVVGKESISRFNFMGRQRESSDVSTMMRKIAASMGGDAVINITMDGQKVEGTVISYEKVVL